MLVEPPGKSLDVCRTAVGVADRVDLEHVVGHADAAQELCVELDHLGVDRRIVGTDRLDRELPVLAVTAALRPVVPPHRTDRVELLRLRLAVEPMLDVGAADRRRRFRPQGQGAPAAIGERVRLLLHDVGPATGGSDDQLGVLESGRVDPPVSVEPAEILHLALDPVPERLLGWKDVVRAARRFDARHARSSARNGFRASSAPSVVFGPWPE